MMHDQIVVLHSKQPMGEGLRRALSAHSRKPPLILTEGQGPLFRDTVDLSTLRVERLGQADWWEFLGKLPAGTVLVSNDEYCLEPCRALRARRGERDVFPPSIDLYRDKALMRARLREAGLPVPATVTLAAGVGSAALRAAFEQLGGGKAVLKPCDEANLRGIRVVESAEQAAALARELKQDAAHLLEAFYPDAQYHANCLAYDGQVSPLLVGEYTAPLLDLASGKPAGSITLDAQDARGREVMALALRAVQALGAAGRFVAHAEFLSSGAELVIGEVACRAPGGDVPWQAAQHCGVDLEELNISLQLGGGPARPSPTCAAGWLWFPRRAPPSATQDGAGSFVPRFLGAAWLGHAPSTADLREQVVSALRRLP